MNLKNFYNIGIYTGKGASHSWLWFVELLENSHFLNLSFIDSESIINNPLESFNVLIFSGGDTFSVAESLGHEGAEKVKNFIFNGGLYIGSCAGAYFPIKFDFPPLNYFNLVDAEIGNFAHEPPEPVLLPEKFSCPYGDGFVYHPFRGETLIRFPDTDEVILAPLFGGPSFERPIDCQALAYYHGFTEKTLFLCERIYAEVSFLNKIAIITKSIGAGNLILTGPHLEAPGYPEANEKLIKLITSKAIPQNQSPCEERIDGFVNFDTLKKLLSNARIMARGLVERQLKWKVGRKTYEAEKVLYFIDFVWKQLNSKGFKLASKVEQVDKLNSEFNEILSLLRRVSKESEPFEDLLEKLKKAVISALELYMTSRKTSGERIYA